MSWQVKLWGEHCKRKDQVKHNHLRSFWGENEATTPTPGCWRSFELCITIEKPVATCQKNIIRQSLVPPALAILKSWLFTSWKTAYNCPKILPVSAQMSSISSNAIASWRICRSRSLKGRKLLHKAHPETRNERSSALSLIPHCHDPWQSGSVTVSENTVCILCWLTYAINLPPLGDWTNWTPISRACILYIYIMVLSRSHSQYYIYIMVLSRSHSQNLSNYVEDVKFRFRLLMQAVHNHVTLHQSPQDLPTGSHGYFLGSESSAKVGKGRHSGTAAQRAFVRIKPTLQQSVTRKTMGTCHCWWLACHPSPSKSD